MPVNSIEGKPTSEEFDKSIYGNEECKEDEPPTLTSSPIKKDTRKGKSKKSYKPYLSYGITTLTPIAKSKTANDEKIAQKVKSLWFSQMVEYLSRSEVLVCKLRFEPALQKSEMQQVKIVI